MSSDWEAVATHKRNNILTSIPPKWLIHISEIPSNEEQKDVTGTYIHKYLSKKEIEITETDVVGIAKQTASGDWSAVEVAEAFCHRASLAHQLVHCLHETFYDAALADAKALDEYLAKEKKPKGPLHGVPISLKDQFHVKDVETSMGYVGWIGTFEGQKDHPKYKTYESEMVRELRALGAVLYCKTSVPHTLMTGETVNNIIDYTYNPKNRNLASGGSSGGEGALIGLRGSPAGFGTDIGGSIRIPAGFNGLYGIRPSAGRMPYEGMANSMDGQNSILSVVGPLATSAASLRLILQSILGQQPWLHDPLVIEMPWREDISKKTQDLATSKKLVFGILRTDGFVNPHPPVARAISMVSDAVSKAGHKTLQWSPPDHQKGLAQVLNTWLFDGGKDCRAQFALSGEKVAPQVAELFGPDAANQRVMGADEVAQTNVAIRAYRKEYLDYWLSTAAEAGNDDGVDAVIMPLAPYTAARRERYGYYGYSVIINGLDYTSVVVPVTTADQNVDKEDKDYKPLNDTDRASWESYDASIYDGAHVAVQVVGRRLTEEKTLAIAEYVGELLGKADVSKQA